jgi:hypothetical protein
MRPDFPNGLCSKEEEGDCENRRREIKQGRELSGQTCTSQSVEARKNDRIIDHACLGCKWVSRFLVVALHDEHDLVEDMDGCPEEKEREQQL